MSIKKTVLRRLSALNSSEKEWIQYCLLENVQTIAAPLVSRTANSLFNKGIVSQGSGDSLSLPYHIEDFVWEYLKAHKKDFLPRSITDDSKKVQDLLAFPEKLHF